MGRLARDRPLSDLSNAAEDILRKNGVVRSDHLDTDDTDTRVILPSVVDAIAKVTQPSLQLRAVVLLNKVPVRHDAGDSADGCPLAHVVEEGDVDVGIRGEVVCLAGLGVGVKEQINTTVLLLFY
jgi:hypothetical protein